MKAVDSGEVQQGFTIFSPQETLPMKKTWKSIGLKARLMK
jgi:hypothetical protein